MRTQVILYTLLFTQAINAQMVGHPAQSFSNDHKLGTFTKSAIGESNTASQIINLCNKPLDINIVDAGLNTITEAWVARYNGPGNSVDEASAIAVDQSGNVYVTGYSTGSGTGEEYTTIKYNSEGVEQWVARYSANGDYLLNRATAIAVDGDGNVYVTGHSYGSGTGVDYATIKYNSEGVEQWVARYNGPGNNYDRARSIAVTDSGNVYVTGHSYGSGLSEDYATIKYDTAGIEKWVARFNGPGNISDEAKGITVDDYGNVYVTGHSLGSGTGYDYATISYNLSGKEQWTARYNGPGNGHDYAVAIAIDGSGNIYVTGRSFGYNTAYDYATIKYNKISVSVEDNYVPLPNSFKLYQNYPNPFYSSTAILFEISQASKVVLKVLNSLGLEVETLVDEIKQPGSYEVMFNAWELSSGVYFYRLQVGSFFETKKLILLR